MNNALVTFSSLYPNSSQPGLGLFVEARLRQLLQAGDYQPRVIAPVPWFPFRASVFGQYSRSARVPRYEERYDIPIWHPRYFHLPKVAMYQAPNRLYQCASKLMTKWKSDGMFEPKVIDAHYFFPEGVAASFLAEKFDVPLVVTARGSDINYISGFPKALAAMRKTAHQAAAVVGVSEALAKKMEALGFPAQKIHVLRNGVDTGFFCPGEREEIRSKMKVKARLLVSVGNLIELKGHHLVIKALTQLPDTELMIAGSGPMKAQLLQLADVLDLRTRVHFLGQLTQHQLRDLYRAADALVLASSREGLANVLLESIACGTRVIATTVGGNAEVIDDKKAGLLVRERSASAIVEAVVALEKGGVDRALTAQYAQKFAWSDTRVKLDRLLRSIM